MTSKVSVSLLHLVQSIICKYINTYRTNRSHTISAAYIIMSRIMHKSDNSHELWMKTNVISSSFCVSINFVVVFIDCRVQCCTVQCILRLVYLALQLGQSIFLLRVGMKCAYHSIQLLSNVVRSYLVAQRGGKLYLMIHYIVYM